MDNTLYDAFGQRLISVMYTQLNQYHVVLEVDPQYRDDPDSLKNIYVPPAEEPRQARKRSGATVQVPNGQRRSAAERNRTLGDRHRRSLNHQGQFPAVTISFNLGTAIRWAKR